MIVNAANYSKIYDLNTLLVREIDDGGMGSVEFLNADNNRSFYVVVGSLELIDADDVPVIATLIIDKNGDFYQLDIWKVDFSKSINLRLLDE